MKPATLLPILMILAACPALAADSGAASPAGRFQLAPSRDGFVRLDTRTGATSHCGYDGKAWVCESLGEADSALKARVDALAAQVATLTATVRMLADRIGAEPPEAAVKSPPPAREPSFAVRAVTPLLDFVRRLKSRDGSA